MLWGLGTKSECQVGGCINMRRDNTSNTHCGPTSSMPDFSTNPNCLRHQSKIYLCWSLNVTDRRNTPPEPQYTAVKTISTQALPALQRQPSLMNSRLLHFVSVSEFKCHSNIEELGEKNFELGVHLNPLCRSVSTEFLRSFLTL